jgi:glycine hydroxymethyltransferase
MNLSHGGHLTHGHSAELLGRFFNVVAYGVRKEDERIDYEAMLKLAEESKPKLVVVGASAYPRIIDFAAVRRPPTRRARVIMADIAHIAGPRRGGPAPEPGAARGVRDHDHAQDAARPARRLVMCQAKWAKELDKLRLPGVQGGPLMHVIAAKAVAFKEALQPEFKATSSRSCKRAGARGHAARRGLAARLRRHDNHLVLVDVFARGITGKAAEAALDRAGITVNKNTIPFDQNSPMVGSGVRIGTPALTTRGMKEAEMETIGRLISRALKGVEQESELQAVRREVLAPVRALPALRGAPRGLRSRPGPCLTRSLERASFARPSSTDRLDAGRVQLRVRVVPASSREGRRPALLWWAIGMITYGLGTLTESLTTLFGWQPFVFRVWYIVGAFLGGYPLAQGSIYLLMNRRFADWSARIVTTVIVIGAILMFLTPLDASLAEPHRLSGAPIVWKRIRLISPFLNIYAVAFLVGGAILSAAHFRKSPELRSRFYGNVLIALGGILPRSAAPRRASATSRCST